MNESLFSAASINIFFSPLYETKADAALSGVLVTYLHLWNDYDRRMTSINEERRDLYFARIHD